MDEGGGERGGKIIDRLTVQKEFKMDNTAIIEENSQHHLDFRTTLAWFFEFLLIFKMSYRRLLIGSNVKFINLYLVTSNDAFHECGVICGLKNHLFGNRLSIFFLQEIQVLWNQLHLNTSQAQNFG